MSYLPLSVTFKNDKAMPKAKSKTNKGGDNSKQQFRLCVPPCPRYIAGGDTNSLCVVCLGAKHAESALSLRREPSPALPATLVPHLLRQRGDCGRGVCKCISWREWRWASPFLLPPPWYPAPPRVRKHALMEPFFYPQGERSALRLLSSEEDDGESADEPPQSAQYKELVEVITCAVAKLNLEWPAEKHAEPSKSKLDDRF